MAVGRVVAVALTVLGALLIAVGIGCIYWPAGLIAAGVLLLAGLFGPVLE